MLHREECAPSRAYEHSVRGLMVPPRATPGWGGVGHIAGTRRASRTQKTSFNFRVTLGDTLRRASRWPQHPSNRTVLRRTSEANPIKRSTLQKLLVAAEDKLAKDLGLLNDLAREIAKCQEWIASQRLLVENLERDGHDVTTARALLNGVTETLD
jgi:hypothetical protein